MTFEMLHSHSACALMGIMITMRLSAMVVCTKMVSHVQWLQHFISDQQALHQIRGSSSADCSIDMAFDFWAHANIPGKGLL